MNKKFDATEILAKLAEIRKSIPGLGALPPRPRPADEGRARAFDATDFEYTAVADALDSLASDLHAVSERAMAEATEKALQVYYVAEELARDPEHADLIPHVEAMRRAYEKDFGKPIPPKPKK
jgi:hypothetical protein